MGICLERSLEMVVGLLGILKSGGAYVPLDPNTRKERLAFMLADAGSPILLTHSACRKPPRPQQQSRSAGCGLASDRRSGRSGNVAGRVKAEHLAYVIYTSGSTGRPKGASEHSRTIVNRLLSMQDAYGS